MPSSRIATQHHHLELVHLGRSSAVDCPRVFADVELMSLKLQENRKISDSVGHHRRRGAEKNFTPPQRLSCTIVRGVLRVAERLRL
jgi:hypothetical protein